MADRTPPRHNRLSPPPLRRPRRNPQPNRNQNRPRRRLNLDDDGIPDSERPDYDPNTATDNGENNSEEPLQPDLKF